MLKIDLSVKLALWMIALGLWVMLLRPAFPVQPVHAAPSAAPLQYAVVGRKGGEFVLNDWDPAPNADGFPAANAYFGIADVQRALHKYSPQGWRLQQVTNDSIGMCIILVKGG